MADQIYDEKQADYKSSDSDKRPDVQTVPVFDKDGPIEFAEKADLRCVWQD